MQLSSSQGSLSSSSFISWSRSRIYIYIYIKCRKRIEDELTFESNTISTTFGEGETQIISSFTNFQMKTEYMLQSMALALELYIALWKELLEETPSKIFYIYIYIYYAYDT